MPIKGGPSAPSGCKSGFRAIGKACSISSGRRKRLIGKAARSGLSTSGQTLTATGSAAPFHRAPYHLCFIPRFWFRTCWTTSGRFSTQNRCTRISASPIGEAIRRGVMPVEVVRPHRANPETREARGDQRADVRTIAAGTHLSASYGLEQAADFHSPLEGGHLSKENNSSRAIRDFITDVKLRSNGDSVRTLARIEAVVGAAGDPCAEVCPKDGLRRVLPARRFPSQFSDLVRVIGDANSQITPPPLQCGRAPRGGISPRPVWIRRLPAW
jgi:hypothetical protein